MKFNSGKHIYLFLIRSVLISFLFSCGGGVQSEVYDVSGLVLLCECANDSVNLTLTSTKYGVTETVTDSQGNYVFKNVWKGMYTITPKKEGYTFFPASREVTVSNGNIELVDFDTISSFTKTYGSIEDNGEAFSVVQANDCGFLISGYRDVSTSGTENLDMWVMKTDLWGKVIWENTYGQEYYPDIAYSAIFDLNNNIVVAGYCDSIDSGAFNILKYENSGDDWTLSLDDVFYFGTTDLPEKPAYLLETMDNDYLVGGFSGGTEGSLEDIYGVRISESGTALATLNYGVDDSEKSNAADLILRDSSYAGYFIIAGESKDSLGGTTGLLLKRDDDFVNVWTREYKAVDPSTKLDCYYTSFDSVKEDIDGGYICAGTVKTTSLNTRDIYIIKTDKDGNELWSRLYDSGSDDFKGLIVLTSDGGYAVGSTCLSLDYTNSCFRIMKLSSTGEVQWEKEYDGGEDSDLYLNSIIQTHDGGYALCGVKTSYNGKNQAYMVKTDRDGELPSE